MENKFHFSKTSLKNLSAPPGKRLRAYDSQVPGLAVYVSPSGSKTFYFKRKIGGKSEEIRIGPVDAISLVTAREIAARYASQLASGITPEVLKGKEESSLMTLSALLEEWTAYGKKKGKRSVEEEKKSFARYFQDLANKPLDTITRSEVRKFHDRLGDDHGIYTANRSLALIRAMYNFAKHNLDIDVENPAAGIPMFREESRSRRLFSDEIPRFFAALETLRNPDMRDYFLLALFLGARRSNLQSMRWDEIFLVRRVWVIPKEKAKAKLDIEVPLTDPAMEILVRRKEESSGSPWVFPGTGKSGHLVEPKKSWYTLCKRAGLEGLRLHDLRRSFASFQIDAGVPLPVIGKGLGHQSSKTTEIYARLSMTPVEQGMNAGANAILKAAGVFGKKGKSQKKQEENEVDPS